MELEIEVDGAWNLNWTNMEEKGMEVYLKMTEIQVEQAVDAANDSYFPTYWNIQVIIHKNEETLKALCQSVAPEFPGGYRIFEQFVELVKYYTNFVIQSTKLQCTNKKLYKI